MTSWYPAAENYFWKILSEINWTLKTYSKLNSIDLFLRFYILALFLIHFSL